ncbi:hypothetical protein [Planctomycetes bacterium K23_9]|uniref:Uncharacterized protein n=1 Tax=Stieleria marina TaxID=1930275 RepID=A0A517NZI8_9BACT|nr:hypothetical protein K239x_45410 [Planctomycetes bacterium K23_9]
MSQTDSPIFAVLADHRANCSEMLDQLVDHFRQSRLPIELFEALKMRIRHGLGMPLLASDDEATHPEDAERQLEAGLLDACRETGTMLIQDGRITDGWMYLRPTGDTSLARDLVQDIEINDDNYDDMIQVLLHEGVDVGRGFQAVLDHQGTCNSITLYEQSLSQRSKTDQQAAASRLLNHLYDELIGLVRDDITERDSAPDPTESLADMITSRKWVLDEGGYHLDTTHLASTVRIASVLTDQPSMKKAWEMTQYGRRLNHQFQYPGDEPFVDFYPAYSTFYSVLLGDDVDAGLKYFERKAKSVDVVQHGTAAIETYVSLLDRSGRFQEAIDAAISLVPDDVPAQRIVPLLMDIADRSKASSNGDAYEAILGYCQRRNDVLGYAAALHASQN